MSSLIEFIFALFCHAGDKPVRVMIGDFPALPLQALVTLTALSIVALTRVLHTFSL